MTYSKILSPITIAQHIVGVQPMTTPTYSLFNIMVTKTYNNKHWPHQYTINLEDIHAAEQWCWQRFKGRNWNNTRHTFVFKRSKDAVMFTLRWGS